MLKIRNLNVSYGNVPIVKNISFDVAPGQIVGIVGESGSGKSTVIRSILGMLGKGGRITSGQILFHDMDLTAFSGKDWKSVRGKKISMIFQQPERSMDPTATIGQQYVECARVGGNSDKRKSLDQAEIILKQLHFADPDRVLRSYPFQLSGGMCQRAAIALAMCNTPELLLADEPTSALDVTVQKQTIDVMMELRSRYHTSILLVTHNMGVIGSMADMVGVVYHGELVEWGTREEILYNPCHPYTRALIAAIPTMDGKMPQSIKVTETMPYTVYSDTHWAGTE